jgi:hypothetical protein
MNREELAALRDAIEVVLTWPDAVKAEMARWLTPEAAKGNCRDPHPPPIAARGKGVETASIPLSQSPPPPRPGKARLNTPPTSAKATDRKLIEAMRDNPGLTVVALANAARSSRSATGDRLRRLAASGAIEKDAAGRWRLVGEKAGPTQPPSP